MSRKENYSPNKYPDIDIIHMFECLVDNICVEFYNRIYQHTVGIPMGTNCDSLTEDLFLYSYGADFAQHLQTSKFKKQKTLFYLNVRYILIYNVMALQ